MLYIDLKKAAHKLHYRTEFQGLPISIENRKGSKRHWYDPHNKTEGSTTMEYPYGYVRGTLGTDGDAVDVFLGPNKDSDRVFVVTQMKAPDFKEIDEQKCFLGFKTEKQVKAAYMRQYDDPKFFGGIKTITINEFKDRLKKKGKLIKTLKTGIISNGGTMKKSLVRLVDPDTFKSLMSGKKDDSDEDLDKKAKLAPKKVIDPEQFDLKKENVQKKFTSDAQRKYMHSAADRGDIPKKVVEEFQSKTPKGADLPEKVKKSEDVEKALNSRVVSSMVKRYRQENAVDAYKAGIAQPQPNLGSNKTNDLIEPLVVPVRRVLPPPNNVFKAESFEACGSCGYMTKSESECPKCSAASSITEAGTYWNR